MSIVEKAQEEQITEIPETENEDYIEVDGWQWILIILGIVFVLILINASFANYQY